MHFYTYDEWVANAYYSQDDTEIIKGTTKIYDLDDAPHYLSIRSCWKNPEFVSTYPGVPSVVPTLEKIDLDIGCLYQFKDGAEYSDSTYEGYRLNRGCVQTLGGNLGSSSLSSFPYIRITPGSGVNKAKVYYDNFTNLNKEVLTINLREHSSFDRILIFQSIYSGAISFEEASSSLEFYFTNDSDTDSNIIDYDYRISTNLYSPTSLMIVGALLTFDSSSDKDYLLIDNISQFVYGHANMSAEYDWNMIWKNYTPSDRIMPSSIMHYEKMR